MHQQEKEIEILINEIETFFSISYVAYEMAKIKKETPIFMVQIHNLIKKYEGGDLMSKPKIDLALSMQNATKIWRPLSDIPKKIKEFLSKSELTGLSKSKIFEVIICYS